MCPDTWVKTYALNDGFTVQSFHFSVCVKFIEIADTESQVGVGEELDCFSLFHAHEECINIFFDSPFLQKGGKYFSCFLQHSDIRNGTDRLIFFRKLRTIDDLRITYDDTARIKVVIKSLAFTKELR